MRTIKFRGIRKENDKWVYGNYAIVRMYVETDDLDLYERNGVSLIIKNNANCEVFCGITGYEEVYANTLGQFTGLYDKNGKEIYDGDIVKVTDDNDEISELNSDTGIGAIEWLDKWGFWNISRIENSLGDINNSYDIEVIGNIHDNSELLEREGKKI